jgi:hypothetical protein
MDGVVEDGMAAEDRVVCGDGVRGARNLPPRRPVRLDDLTSKFYAYFAHNLHENLNNTGGQHVGPQVKGI